MHFIYMHFIIEYSRIAAKMSIKLIKLLNSSQAKYLLIDFDIQSEAHINSHFSRLIAANQPWAEEQRNGAIHMVASLPQPPPPHPPPHS